MLVLSRYANEQIVIVTPLGNVVLHVIESRWVEAKRERKFRVCIEAPHEIPIHRGEVYEAIRQHDLTTVEAIEHVKRADTDLHEQRPPEMGAEHVKPMAKPLTEGHEADL